MLGGVSSVGDASVQQSASYTTRSYKAGNYPRQNHLEIGIGRCASRMASCESNGVSQAEDRSENGNGQRFFEALAIFSPFKRMTTHLANRHEEGRCILCHVLQCIQNLCAPSERAVLPWLMPWSCGVSDTHSLAAVRGLCCIDQVMHRAVSPSTVGPGP